MKYIDFHCDTLCSAFYQNKTDLTSVRDTMINMENIKAGECMAQFFAAFMIPEGDKKEAPLLVPEDDVYIRKLKSILDSTCDKMPDLTFAANYDEMVKNRDAAKISAFFTLEDGRAVQGRMDKLEEFYSMGVRLISLTWNFANCFGYPNSDDRNLMQLGLTGFGKDAVKRMNELGMLVDVSHLSDGGFWDVMEVSSAPPIASHSNCRSLSPHRRNLSDEMIKALADKGGVAGLNFCPAFLNADINCDVSTAELIAKHAAYMANCGGLETVAIGSDFDGIRGKLEVGSPDKMYLIWDALKKAGFKEDAIEYIAYKNAERIIKDTLK